MAATGATHSGSESPRAGSCWLFSRNWDLLAFAGSAALALLALPVGRASGVLFGDTPDWAWVPAILLIDVAHVYATGFRVYFDRDELRRRPLLYGTVPLAAFVLGIVVYSEGEVFFWRCLAYLAVFHFIRQQYGWVALYRAKVGERDRWGYRIDSAAIYAATLYPLLYWHANLPRGFWWFLPGDFVQLPEFVAAAAAPGYWLILAVYVVDNLRAWRRGVRNPGKHIVVATTAVCWYVGIISFNSDYAFTVTNVIIHGIPYMVLVYWYWRSRHEADLFGSSGWKYLVQFLATLWLLAYLEEMVWHRAVYQSRDWLFGAPIEARSAQWVLVPLLAVPQLSHYILDGFIWKRRRNPHLQDFTG